MRNTFMSLLGLLGLGGCSVGSSARPGITFDVEPNEIGYPLTLTVHNDSDDQLCFPASSLTTDNSQDVRFTKNGQEPERLSGGEYVDDMPASGPFYFVSPHRVTKLPIDTDSLVMPTDAYDFNIKVSWFRCDDIDTSDSVSMRRSSKAVVAGRVKYTHIYYDGRAAKFRKPD
jgi:hypothetical protein